MKVVFLDFDGVITSTPGSYKRKPTTEFDPYHCQFLNQITDATGAAIVVSSSWRWCQEFPTIEDLAATLAESGVTGDVIDRTPDLTEHDKYHYGQVRADEILRWVAEHPVESFVALDDIYPEAFETIKDRWVNTHPDGLLAESVPLALQILQRPLASASSI